MEREQFTLISVLLILAEFYLCTEANSYKQLQVYLEKSNVQLTRSKSASVGDMSRIACAGKCLELGDECCKATYIESTKECRIGLNGCCNIPEEYVPGTYLLQAKPPLLIGPLQTPLTVSNGLNKGTWKNTEFCHIGHYAIGYKIKVESTNIVDFTGANSIILICGSKAGYECGDKPTSGIAPWGVHERQRYCPLNTVMESFNMQSEESKGPLVDDSATNWIKFKCRDLHTSTGIRIIGAPRSDLTYLRGKFGGWSNSCPLGTAICGIQTRILDAQLASDEMALTDVKFFCCY